MKKLELISWRNLCNNIKFAIDGTPLIQTIINSFFVSTVASLIGLLVALLGAYYYVYQNAHHSKIWFYLTICAMYIPEATLLIPSFVLFKNMGILALFLLFQRYIKKASKLY